MLRSAIGALFGTASGATAAALTDSVQIAVLVGLVAACLVWGWRLLIDALDEALDALT